MLSPHHRNDVKNAFRHQKRQRSYQFWHLNGLNIQNALHRRGGPIAGAKGIHQMYLPCGQTSAHSLPTNVVRLEVQFALPAKSMSDLPPFLTASSSRSLRSLGRAKARPLT
jgi:hypothetical protein